MNEYIYTWIAFHGITDILLPINIWCPIYTLSLLSYFIPMNILNFITILTSTVHFTNDLYFFNCNDILLCLLLLLYFGEYKFPQYIILSYMSIIHVPIHLIKLHYTQEQQNLINWWLYDKFLPTGEVLVLTHKITEEIIPSETPEDIWNLINSSLAIISLSC